MQTELKQIGSIILFLTLFLNSASEELSGQVESAKSERTYCLLPQVGSEGRTTQSSCSPKEVEISTGFAFLNGQYVCPPYTIASTANKVSLNGVALPDLSFACSTQRMSSDRLTDWLKQILAKDGLLIHLDENTMTIIPYYQALPILDTLLSSQSPEAKIKDLIQEALTEYSSEQWAYLVHGFETSPEIQDRVAILRETHTQSQELGSKTSWYLTGSFPMMPILGFVLSVLALGTLLSCPPPTAFSRLGQRHQKIYCQQVFYLVGLFVVLNLYDLACTLFAKGGVGFWEMNPFAGYVLDVPRMVICFKLCLTICPAILLIVARHRRLAQMASWWGGVVYTVLILRWVTYNAMFMH